ncbi:hypothetical protein CL629_01270 [bacterium]|nr:hypothetical protein [bacterium]|tara:strand:- start:1690 stop:2121 length:432 start_codon:yes stop_codon:yes gene_type:complete
MVKVQHFTENFEQNVQHAGERVQEYKESPDFREAPKREVVKKSLRQEKAPLPPPPSASQDEDDDVKKEKDSPENMNSFLPDYFNGGDAEGMGEAVGRLAETALHGNLEKSLKDARKLTPFLEDAFHDSLVDKLLPEMKRRGII